MPIRLTLELVSINGQRSPSMQRFSWEKVVEVIALDQTYPTTIPTMRGFKSCPIPRYYLVVWDMTYPSTMNRQISKYRKRYVMLWDDLCIPLSSLPFGQGFPWSPKQGIIPYYIPWVPTVHSCMNITHSLDVQNQQPRYVTSLHSMKLNRQVQTLSYTFTCRSSIYLSCWV